MTRMKVIYFSGEIPQGDPEGDQRTLFRKLHLLSKERDHPILTSILEAITVAVKQECSRLERSRKEYVPTFESVLDLTDHVIELRKTSLGGAIERVLVLASQLGTFIAYHEAHPLEYNFRAENAVLIGRGSGLLSGAAIALSPSPLLLPAIAAEITKVAFRFGLIVDQVCRSLEVSPNEINAEGAWVYCVHGVDLKEAQEAVAYFNVEKAYPEASMASVFNNDDRSVSIGGPPSTLRSLFSESEFFRHTRNIPMKKVQGMWHTTTAYGPEHVRQIVEGITADNQLCFPIFSPVSGRPFEATDGTSLLTEIMTEILTQSIRWDRTIDGVSAHLNPRSPDVVQLWSLQPSHYMTSVIERWSTELPAATLSDHTMTPAVLSLDLEQSLPRDAKSSKIAVVGMACRFPGGADDTEKFWELLVQGRDVHVHVPPDRFDVATHVDVTGEKPNTSNTPYGCFIDSPGLFDAFFFGMSPREAEQTDPMHRLALITAYEALESSGYVPGRGIHQRRVGTFYGCASDDYREVNSGQDIGTYFIPGGCRAFGPGRINYFLNFWGPSYSIDTACSSSLAAIQAACTSLWAGDIDMAITGGMNVISNSDVYAGLSKGHFLSSTGGCKTWDEGADGYCRADGVGSVVLKRLEDAEADNDNIIAVVLGAATDHSAEAVSITHPHDLAQAHLFHQIVRRAGIDPFSVGYVEFHGTGTTAGDPTEFRAVTSVFANEKLRNTDLLIGSVKSNVGHGEAAAGVMSFIKTMLVLQKEVVPPHIGIKTGLNPALPEDLAKKGVIIPLAATPWGPSNENKRLAMVNNFGAAGGNTAMLLEEATTRPRIGKDTRSAHPITVSAKTPFSLRQNLRRLVDFIETQPDISIADLSYTLCARKMHYNYRVSMLASSLQEAAALLRRHLQLALDQLPISCNRQAPVAFAFTGQGTFYTGIGAHLYRDSKPFREQLGRLDGIAKRQKFPSFLPIINGNAKDIPIISIHLAIVCVEIALTRLWASLGVKPSVVIGHSLGEYAALNAAGVFSDSDTVFLVGTRARLLETKLTPNTHGMLSVRASHQDVLKAVDGIHFEVACINGPEETVAGAAVADLEALATILEKAGYRTVKLNVPHAYHTSQMELLVDDFVKLTSAVVCKPPRIPIISPLYSKVLASYIDVGYLAKATREPVDYVGGLRAAWTSGVLSTSTAWIEIGHHPCCVSFIAKTLSDTRLVVPTLHRDQDNWITLGKALIALYNTGLAIDWTEYHLPFAQALRLVDTPTYAWDNKNYWIQYSGDWNLTKGQALSDPNFAKATAQTVHGFRTTSIHEIQSETYAPSTAKIIAVSDMTDPALKEVIEGHAMNSYGVASSFLHADMAFTIAKRILDKGLPNPVDIGINIVNFEYHEPVVKHHNPVESQLILVSAEADLEKKKAYIKWYNSDKDMWYCHASISYEENPSSWLSTWARTAGLVTSRIAALNDMAASGKADKLTTNLAYSLFGKLVNYSDMYRTMKSVILNNDEAVAEVEFPAGTGGTWTVPPHFIDGCVSLSGFILNGGTYVDNTKYFYVTPSWKSMRFAKPLAPGGRYLAYVRMVPAGDHDFVGDVYILQGSEIVGVVEAIVFKQWPRVMLDRFFRPPGSKAAPQGPHGPRMTISPLLSSGASTMTSKTRSLQAPLVEDGSKTHLGLLTPVTPPHSVQLQDAKDEPPHSNPATPDSVSRAFEIIAEELGIDVCMLNDDAEVAAFGLDSLMSLVLSQRLRQELRIEIRDAFFLEVSTFGDLKLLLV